MTKLKKICTLLSLGLIAAGTPLISLAQEPARFQIPFAFTIGPNSLHAGEYRVLPAHRDVLQIQTVGGHYTNLFLLTGPDTPSNGQPPCVFSATAIDTSCRK